MWFNEQKALICIFMHPKGSNKVLVENNILGGLERLKLKQRWPKSCS